MASHFSSLLTDKTDASRSFQESEHHPSVDPLRVLSSCTVTVPFNRTYRYGLLSSLIELRMMCWEVSKRGRDTPFLLRLLPPFALRRRLRTPKGVLPYKSDGGSRCTFKGFKFVDWYRLGC